MDDLNDLLIDWILKNVDASVVPSDEGDDDALIYNLIHRVLGDGKTWDDSDVVEAELAEYRRRAGI